MTQHRDIPEDGLHEPKGVSTATAGTAYIADGSGSGTWELPKVKGISSAEDGQVYKANGDGTGTWTYTPQGWGYYQHAGAAQVFSNTYARLEIDGAGSLTDEDYLPREIRGAGSLWDTTDNRITPITLGDSYDLRLDIPVTSETGTVTDITIVLDIGASEVAPSIPVVTRYAVGGRTTPYNVNMAFPVFSKADFLTNGGQIFVKTNNGTITTATPTLYIERKSAGDF